MSEIREEALSRLLAALRNEAENGPDAQPILPNSCPRCGDDCTWDLNMNTSWHNRIRYEVECQACSFQKEVTL